MKETFRAISDALEKSGINTPSNNGPAGHLDYKFTPYSLNTSLSFRFGDVDEFIEFLQLSGPLTEQKISSIHAAFIELGLNPKEFFYVNFFKKDKEEEM